MINNFKVGDKLLCKKDSITKYSRYKKNKYYYIEDIDDPVYDYEEYSYYINDDNNNNIYFWKEYDLYEYFYTAQDVRKLKLKNLYEESES